MFHKNIKLLAWFNFFTDFRFYAAVSILYFQQVTGSYTLGMGVFSVVFISSALFEVPTGIFSDRIGRKNTVVCGAIMKIVGLTLYAIGLSPVIVYLGAVCEGIARSFYSGNNNALLHDTLAQIKKEDEYHVFLGKTSSMLQVAAALAAVIGGFVADISFSLVMWISVIPQIMCLILALQMEEPKVHSKRSGNIFNHLSVAIQKFRENKKLRLLSIASMINFGMGDAGFTFQAAFYNLVWPVWALGIARGIASTVGAISFYISGKLINRFSAIKLLLTESIVTPTVKMIVTMFITPLSPAIMAFMSILYGTGNVAGNSLQQKEFTNEQRATMGSLVSFGGSICWAISAFFLGIIADTFSIIHAVIFAQLVLLSTCYFYVKVYSKYR